MAADPRTCSPGRGYRDPAVDRLTRRRYTRTATSRAAAAPHARAAQRFVESDAPVDADARFGAPAARSGSPPAVATSVVDGAATVVEVAPVVGTVVVDSVGPLTSVEIGSRPAAFARKARSSTYQQATELLDRRVAPVFMPIAPR